MDVVVSGDGGRVAGRYQLEKLVARGAVAEVYRACDTLDGNAVVAIKLIAAKAQAQRAAGPPFEHAADVRSPPEHPSIVRVFGRGELPDGRVYTVMEFVDGDDLRGHLARGGRLDRESALDLLTAVSGGVDAAHRAGVVHGDLKPENIVLPHDGGPPKIVDFIDATAARRMESDGTSIGTPAYMAPEQLRGGPPCPASDVFSLGVLAFEVLTGKLPFGGGSRGEVLLQQANGVPGVGGGGPCLERAVRAALDPDPDRRPPSAAALTQLLDSAR